MTSQSRRESISLFYITYLEPECRALAESAADTVVVIVHFQHSLYDRESETCSDYLALVILGAVILIKDELDLVLLDTVAGILDLDKNAVIGIDLPYKDLFVLAGVVDSVIDKVLDDLLDLHHITADYPRFISRKPDVIAHFLGYSLEAVDYLAELSAYLKL